jgi:wyosine [tRNA(Phe)-imidazoG37] synthetase (radical SAM superfamily)
MSDELEMIAFGPVPSRRLGRSLGINNIPPKICTYSCVYCQVGRTLDMRTERETFYGPEAVHAAVSRKLEEARLSAEPVDVLTFVPDGEPTLDRDLGREIERLRELGVRVAVITNASLIWRKDVRDDLMGADWVSLKVDSIREEIWRRINRPHRNLRLTEILDGALDFSESYEGELVTETMLVQGLNDGDDECRELSEFLARLSPARAYLSVPTRPPAETWVRPPDEGTVNRLYQILSGQVDDVEYLIGYEGNAFASTGDIREDLLSITSVHPMREDAVEAFLERAKAGWSTVGELLRQGRLVRVEYDGKAFYLRTPRRPGS